MAMLIVDARPRAWLLPVLQLGVILDALGLGILLPRRLRRALVGRGLAVSFRAE